MRGKCKKTASTAAFGGFVLMPTFRFFAYLLVAAAAFICAYLRDNPALYLLSAFFLLCVFASVLYGIVLACGVRGTFYYEKPRAPKGGANSVVLELSNKAFLPVFACNAEIFMPETGELDSRAIKTTLSCSAFSNEKSAQDCSYPYAGKYTAQLTRLTVTDPLGMFKCRLRRKSKAEALALPIGDDIRQLSGAADTADNAEHITGKKRGDDFFDLRSYISGDALRDIHWKLSAKSAELVVVRRASDSEKRRVVLCDGGSYYKNGGEYVERDAVFEAVTGLLKGFPQCGTELVLSGGVCVVTDEADCDNALTAMVSAPLHDAGMLPTCFAEHIADCLSLTIVTARLTEPMMELVSSVRSAQAQHLPIDIILCGGSIDGDTEKRLDVLNVGLVRRKGGTV